MTYSRRERARDRTHERMRELFALLALHVCSYKKNWAQNWVIYKILMVVYGSFSSHRVATSRFVGQWKIQKIHKIQREKPPNNICNIIMHSNCCLAACITQWQNTRGVNNNNNNNRKSEQQQLKRVASKIANCNKVWNVKTKKKRSVQTAIEKEAAKTQITIRVKNKRGENIKTKKQQQQSIATATNTIERKKNVSAIYFTHFDCPTIF